MELIFLKYKKLFADNWLLVLLAVQPILDAVAFWFQNSVATVSGYLRLAVLIILPVAVLIKTDNKKRLIYPCGVIGLFCALHILNGFRLGYQNIFSDVQYILRVIQMPVLAVSFMCCIKDEGMKEQAIRGLKASAVLFVAMFIIAVVTGTYTPTYTNNVGYSGWVIDGNRCANSIILVTLSTFVMYFAYISKSRLETVCLVFLVCALLILNGTKACYIAELGLLAAYGVYTVLEVIVNKIRPRWDVLAVCIVLLATSVLIYPYTPRAIEDRLEGAGTAEIEIRFRKELADAGYDIDTMSVEEKLADEYLLGKFTTYYHIMLDGGIPELLNDYDAERVLRSYDMTADARTLIDTRIMKRTYAKFIFEDSDTITKFVGFEFYNIGYNADGLDLENDYPAILYYYGYIGIALLIGFILYFLFLVGKAMLEDFKGSLTPLNYTLIVCLALQLALAQLSGALLRRPNVSVYLSVVLALIYFQTACKNLKGEAKHD